MKSFYTPRYWPTWLGLGLLRIVNQLPHSIQIKTGQGLGYLAQFISRRRRHITLVNIQLCFPELSKKEQKKLVSQSFASIGAGVIEMGLAWWAPMRRLDKLYTITGLEHLEPAFSKGKGIIVLGAHFTTLDLIGRLSSMNYPFSVTYREMKNQLVNKIMKEKREGMFVESIDRHDIRRYLKILKNNGALWYAPDQDYGRKHSVFAPFFGVPAATIKATARLARLSGATVLPCFQYRLPDGKGYRIEIQPPLSNFPSDDDVADATKVNQILEAAIRKCPDQYLWQHRRFKTRPEGEKRPY